jgi:hypothetical protein
MAVLFFSYSHSINESLSVKADSSRFLQALGMPMRSAQGGDGLSFVGAAPNTVGRSSSTLRSSRSGADRLWIHIDS